MAVLTAVVVLAPALLTLYQLSGLILILVGGIAQGFFSSYMDFFGGKYETPAIGVIILGFIILIISFFGCCGAKKENVAMLRIFGFLMVVVLILEFAAAVTIAVMRPNIEELVTQNMNSTMYQYYDNKTLVTKTWDDMQTNYKCCGTVNYTDWEGTPYGKNETVEGVPDSCCKIYEENCGHGIWNLSGPPENIYTEGCFRALCDSARSNLGAVIGGIVGLGLLQMVGIWMSCCLIRAVKERYEIL